MLLCRCPGFRPITAPLDGKLVRVHNYLFSNTNDSGWHFWRFFVTVVVFFSNGSPSIVSAHRHLQGMDRERGRTKRLATQLFDLFREQGRHASKGPPSSAVAKASAATNALRVLQLFTHSSW